MTELTGRYFELIWRDKVAGVVDGRSLAYCIKQDNITEVGEITKEEFDAIVATPSEIELTPRSKRRFRVQLKEVVEFSPL